MGQHGDHRAQEGRGLHTRIEILAGNTERRIVHHDDDIPPPRPPRPPCVMRLRAFDGHTGREPHSITIYHNPSVWRLLFQITGSCRTRQHVCPGTRQRAYYSCICLYHVNAPSGFPHCSLRGAGCPVPRRRRAGFERTRERHATRPLYRRRRRTATRDAATRCKPPCSVEPARENRTCWTDSRAEHVAFRRFCPLPPAIVVNWR